MRSTRVTCFLLMLVACVLAVSGCSETYDWREVSPAQAPMKFMLPAKPAEMTRTINLKGLSVDMHMHGARAGGNMFTAAWVRLPGAGAGAESVSDRQMQAGQALQAMKEGMINNIGGKIIEQQERTVALVAPGGAIGGQVPAQFVEATGMARNEPIRMQAIFVGLGDDVFQFVLIGADWSDEVAGTFFDSVRLQVVPVRAAQ